MSVGAVFLIGVTDPCYPQRNGIGSGPQQHTPCTRPPVTCAPSR